MNDFQKEFHRLQWVGGALVRGLLRARILPAAPIPTGPSLLVASRLSWADALLLQSIVPNRIRFLVPETCFFNRSLGPLLHYLGAQAVSFEDKGAVLRQLLAAFRRGEMVCLASGEAGSFAHTQVQRDFLVEIARAAEAPIVPVRIEGAPRALSWKTLLGELWRRVASPSKAALAAFGTPISSETASETLLRERLWDLGEAVFQAHSELEGSLGRAAIRGLKRDMRGVAIVDGIDDSRLSRGMLLAAGLALASWLRRHCQEPRVAIVLPPGKGAAVANLAVVLAGKVPVNLNFTAGRTALEAASRIAGLRTVLTASAFQSRVPDFPWPENVVRIEEHLPRLRPRILAWRLVAALLPDSAIAGLAGVAVAGDRSEAVTLFTSGSSGEPKGVVLSHRNLLGNVRQFSSMLGLCRDDGVLACLPVFHSFGSTVNLWFPILEGLRMVTFPSPLDIPKNAELIRRHRVKLVCSTPTFLRGYLKRAEPHQLASVELLVTGAEKLPADLAAAFEARFRIPVLQGYGLTETSPVVSVNLPGASHPQFGGDGLTRNRPGSVGRLAPGMSARIRDPETHAPLPLGATGMLWLKGPNIFEGYLHDPSRTAEVLQEGWLRTGDLGRFDPDGFLYIEGRLSRFSKIAGEMVPHETVEAAICKALGVAGEERVFAVAGVPDVAKGEALVLLSTRDLTLAALRQSLLDSGLPNLWMPRRIVRCEEIPHLASGKLDLRRIQEAALKGAPETGSSTAKEGSLE